jgi:glutamine synthetase
LAAGLKGVEEELKPPAPAEGNVYHMTPEQRKKMGIGTLPASLLEALQLMEKSKLVKETLGEHTFNAFSKIKRLNGISSALALRITKSRNTYPSFRSS